MKHLVRFCLIIGLALSPTIAQAQLVDLANLKSNWPIMLGGIAVTIAGHELGHFLVAEIEDADAYFDNFTVKYRNQDDSDQQALRLSSAGFQSQWIISELAFAELTQPSLSSNKQALLGGLVLGHIAITAAYLAVLKDHQEGDTTGIAGATSYSSNDIAWAIALPAAIDAWRLFGKQTPRWAPWVSAGAKAGGIAAVWQF